MVDAAFNYFPSHCSGLRALIISLYILLMKTIKYFFELQFCMVSVKSMPPHQRAAVMAKLKEGGPGWIRNGKYRYKSVRIGKSVKQIYLGKV